MKIVKLSDLMKLLDDEDCPLNQLLSALHDQAHETVEMFDEGDKEDGAATLHILAPKDERKQHHVVIMLAYCNDPRLGFLRRELDELLLKYFRGDDHDAIPRQPNNTRPI